MALIPPFFLDCVLAIGLKNVDGPASWIGTGFLYGARVVIPGTADARYMTFLVTNRHVRNLLKGRDAFVRCNPTAGESFKDYAIIEHKEDGSAWWFEHPDATIDVAVVGVDLNKLHGEGMKVAFFANDTHAASLARTRDELGLSEGDHIYVLGFPMGLAAESNTVIARGGYIARIRDMHANKSRTFMVDSQFFPGNSGGPVLSRPEMMSIQGTKSQGAAYLIGIAHSYVFYSDTAVSAQTGHARVVFEENSGLAVAHPIDCIEEAIDLGLAAIGATRWVAPVIAQATTAPVVP